MTRPIQPPVRPTLRALNDLGRALPSIDIRLEAIDHPLIAKAQHIPGLVESSGAERILSLNDRIWYKCKVVNLRGAVTRLGPDDALEPVLIAENNCWWWLGAAGARKSDGVDDFYHAIELEAIRQGSGTSSHVKTIFLLPSSEDYDRLRAELAWLFVSGIKDVVLTLIARSMLDNQTYEASITGHRIVAAVMSKDGDTYLAVGSEGFVDPKLMAVVLNAVPLMNEHDWIPEPGEVLGIKPNYGQIVYSAIIPFKSQEAILQFYGDDV